MPFRYNPHKHVKIWLSKDPNVFMNLENQMRLIKMRYKNPQASIHLIYDSTLLNDKAIKDLHQFCYENKIKPVDADTFIKCNLTDDEKILFDFYKDEINHKNNGGNLATASDILRVISPCYRLGTYTDLDVSVQTQGLPDTMQVDGPLLLNQASVSLLGYKEIIFVPNELVAVVDETQAKPYLNRIQKGMIAQLSEFHCDIIDKSIQNLTKNLYLQETLRGIVKKLDAAFIEKSNTLKPTKGKRTSRNLRTYIYEVTSDKNKFLDFHRNGCDESNEDVIKRLRNTMRSKVGFLQWLFAREQYNNTIRVLNLDDNQFIQAQMKQERLSYLLYIVLCTTGPLTVTESLYGSLIVTKDEVDRKAGILTFAQQGLKNALLTSINIPLHSSIGKGLSLLTNDVEEISDRSWVSEGRHIVKNRETKLKKRQQELQHTLADELGQAKKNIEAHLQILSDRHNHWFWRYFFSSQRQVKINTLTNTLNCFHPKENVFDILSFNLVLKDIEPLKAQVYGRFFPSQTQRLLTELECLCTEAVIFSITKDKKPRFASKKKSINVMSKLGFSKQKKVSDLLEDSLDKGIGNHKNLSKDVMTQSIEEKAGNIFTNNDIDVTTKIAVRS